MQLNSNHLTHLNSTQLMRPYLSPTLSLLPRCNGHLRSTSVFLVTHLHHEITGNALAAHPQPHITHILLILHTSVACSTQPNYAASLSHSLPQAVDSSNRFLAVGGEGYNLQIWDIQTRLEVFHAKGGKPSRCGLTDLAHITALAFLPTPTPTSPEEPQTDARRVLVGTAKHKLWLYDTAAGKRPQLEVSWGECRITSVVSELDGEVGAALWVGVNALFG